VFCVLLVANHLLLSFVALWLLFYLLLGYTDLDSIVGLVWQLHAESNDYRKKNMGKVLKKAVIMPIPRAKWTHGSGKISYKNFRKMSNSIPSMLYPMFHFSYKLCVTSLGISWWESRKKFFADQRTLAKNEFDAYEQKLEQEKLAQFGAALSTAVLQDTVKAMLAGNPLPPDASTDCIEEAKARVKQIKRKAAKMGVDANLTSKKKKVSEQRKKEKNDEDDADSGDEG
jgi:hypothetical protein|tara:strand:+ start:174 stop:857 length:684 start_codon:yes stop_codon:yes gene_type:complete